MTPDDIRSVWLVSLGVYFAVVAVVAVLLTLILLEARKIRLEVAEVWNVGQKIANNTIHIALLDGTNHVAGGILGSAKGIVAATSALQAHTEACPACPACILAGS